MGSPRITYVARPNTTPAGEVSALASAYRFILNCHAQKEVAEPAPEPDGHDEAKEWKHGRSTAVAYL
jgi:hypothetical protein